MGRLFVAHGWRLACIAGLVGLGCGSEDEIPDAGGIAAVDAEAGYAADSIDGETGTESSEASAPPRYRSFVMLERWARLDPKANNTMTGVPTFNIDGTSPSFTDIDAHCGYHQGSWSEAGKLAPSFGTIKMHIPMLGEVTWVGDAEGGGYQPPVGILGWDTGDTLTVTAAGGELPSFELTDTVPAQAWLTSHDLAKLTAEQLVIPRDQPFALAWEPVETEVFALFLQFDGAAVMRRGILCFFPGTPGLAAISTEVLAQLAPSKDVGFTNFYFSGASRKKLALDRVDVEMVTWKGQSVRARIQ